MNIADRLGCKELGLSAFCYGNEPSGHHACMGGHLATANQLIELAKRVQSLFSFDVKGEHI